jgi:TIGR00255 family protein
MIQSMTGYGKAECILPQGKIIIELRSLNGKNADITIKTQLIPRENEIETRQYLAKILNRGNIDLFANFEQNETDTAKVINQNVFMSYYKQIQEVTHDIPSYDLYANSSRIVSSILRLPDIIDTKKQEVSEENWNTLFNAIKKATANLIDFRSKEGTILYNDVTKRVKLIEEFVDEVEKYESERISAIKERIKNRLNEISVNPDQNRLEQEIIYYLEKLDINEEKVRLRQHCRYFMETINNEEYPGKKLGFIAQEMGREINTMGSKANHAEIQKWVVKMKDELEKIKEQSLNIL